jgi:hypothetical protein
MAVSEPLVLQTNAFEFQLALEKLIRHKSLGIYQISAQLVKAGDMTAHSDAYTFVNCFE